MLTNDVLTRVKGEFLEMPGLCLTMAQAQRLMGLDAETCTEALTTLVEHRFLCQNNAAMYTRATSGRTRFEPEI